MFTKQTKNVIHFCIELELHLTIYIVIYIDIYSAMFARAQISFYWNVLVVESWCFTIIYLYISFSSYHKFNIL